MPDAPALSLSAVRAGYGPTVVLESLELSLAPGEAISVLGRNGVGKSTLLATIMGQTTLHGGSLHLFGDDITGRPTHARVRAGLGYVPQERAIFPSLSVRENLAVAARPGPWDEARVMHLFPNLAARAANAGSHLSGGEQQMLAVARALVGNPSVLLMDEPSEGLAPVIVEELVGALARLRDEAGIAMVLVEQNARLALAFSPRAVVMNRGGVVYDGPSSTLSDDAARLEALVGIDGEASGPRRGPAADGPAPAAVPD